MRALDRVRDLKVFAKQIGCDHLGITNAAEPEDYHRYLSWIQKGYAADMHYMVEGERVRKRGNLSLVLPGVQSVIVGLFKYPAPAQYSSELKFARYGWGEDYHLIVKNKLHQLIEWLKTTDDQPYDYKAYVDTGPILERSLAERAGAGWIGKNTCLIHQELGSYVFIGEILTSQNLPTDNHGMNHCGTCTRCIDACPTHALEKPYELNAEKCISYQTIENRQEHIPSHISENLNGWVAGCDICQEVCPWNQDLNEKPTSALFSKSAYVDMPKKDLLALEKSQFDDLFQKSSFRRIGHSKFMKTLAIVK
ncbi:MAG: tRNA epoxyqueuosine(34) reductase QueG [Bdellovibrionales bacterium]|nr:tRNA epoxyqueuosine(34) reductase QueG [Bdellovibrionales bacterium]